MLPASRIGSYLDDFKQAEVSNGSNVYPFEVNVMSANTCTLKAMHVHKVWMSQLGSYKIAIALCQETRDKWSGMKQIGQYFLVASAANEMGSYGC